MLLAVAVLLVSAGTAAAVTILTVNPNSVSPAEGTLSSSADVTVDSQHLSYTGVEVTALDVVVNNTGGSSHTVDLHVALRDSSGTVVESLTKTGVSVPAGSTTTVTVGFASAHRVDSFTDVEVTVEVTG